MKKQEEITSTNAKVFRLGDNVGFTPLAARTSSGVLIQTELFIWTRKTMDKKIKLIWKINGTDLANIGLGENLSSGSLGSK